jgi:hypothetical protein
LDTGSSYSEEEEEDGGERRGAARAEGRNGEDLGKQRYLRNLQWMGILRDVDTYLH